MRDRWLADISLKIVAHGFAPLCLISVVRLLSFFQSRFNVRYNFSAVSRIFFRFYLFTAIKFQDSQSVFLWNFYCYSRAAPNTALQRTGAILGFYCSLWHLRSFGCARRSLSLVVL